MIIIFIKMTLKKNPYNYEVNYVYRQQGDTDPVEESVVYGITSKSGIKRVFVAGFSANSANDAAIYLEKLCSNGSEQCKL